MVSKEVCQMKKKLILFYLFCCIAFSAQAGVKDKAVRAALGKSAPLAPKVLAPQMLPASTVNPTLSATQQAVLSSAGKTITPVSAGVLPNTAPVVPAAAQPLSVTVPSAAPAPHKMLSSFQMYKVLKNRAYRTYYEAILTQNELPNPGILGQPVKPHELVSLYPMKAKEIYPDKPFLHKGPLSSVLTHLYFLAESNRLYIQHLQQSQDFWPAFNEAIPRFYEEAEATVQPEETQQAMVQWAAAQIPNDIKVLGIGEWHGYREIPAFLADLLEKIEMQMELQNREVILFTEFQTNPDTPGHFLGGLVSCPYGAYYRAVWNRARHLDIEVVGLEDRYVRGDLTNVTAAAGSPNNTYPLQQWATINGVRIRNEHWLKRLAEYREKYPDALFIIYAGSGHLLYNYPFSILSQFKKEETFMLNLVPDEGYLGEGEVVHDTDPLEELNANLSFPQLAIKWQSPDLVQLSGYDARVRLPIDIKAKKEDVARWTAAGFGEVP